MKRPWIVLHRRAEREEDVERAEVVRLVRVEDEDDARCKSACSEEADVVSHTWLHHTELFG